MGLWGYAEGDPTVVGLVVAAIAVLGVAYVVTRVVGRRRARRGKGAGGR